MAFKFLEKLGLGKQAEQESPTANLTPTTPEATVDPVHNKELSRKPIEPQDLADVLAMLNDPEEDHQKILTALAEAVGQIITRKLAADPRGYGKVIDPLQHSIHQEVYYKGQSSLEIQVPVHYYLSQVDRVVNFTLSLTPPGSLTLAASSRADSRNLSSTSTGPQKYIAH
jgi:hypothetical protein